MLPNMSQLHRDHAPEQRTGMTSEEGIDEFKMYMKFKQNGQLSDDYIEYIEQEKERRLAHDPDFFVDWTKEKDKEFKAEMREKESKEEEEERKARIKLGKDAFEEYMRNREEAQVDELQLIDDIIKRECYDQYFFDGWNRDKEQEFSQNYNGEYDDLGDDCEERKQSYDSDETVGEGPMDPMDISAALQTIIQRQDRQIAELKHSSRLRSQTAATDA